MQWTPAGEASCGDRGDDLLPERDSGDFNGGVMGVRSLLDYQSAG